MIKKPISPEVRQQLIFAQREEITEYHIYNKLAEQTKDAKSRDHTGADDAGPNCNRDDTSRVWYGW